MRYSLILLDADGTLLDYDAAERSALRRAFSDFGLPYGERAEEEYRRINGRYWLLYENGEVDARTLQVERFHSLIAALGAGPADADALNETYLGYLAQGSFLLPGALEVFRALSARKALAIVTNGFTRTQRGRILNSALSGCISHLIISEEAGAAKPDPRYFEYALKMIGHPCKTDVLMVGDSLTADIRGGNACGIDTCWLNPARAANGTGIEPDYEIASLGELPAIAMAE
ncbi:MAG: YjjG family noncanonical pyrimidine nucleotidase [Clostridia bacterium]|nr:YjjG family noncanonical pyrimidine nucleotidase [Clostridia bacterium]